MGRIEKAKDIGITILEGFMGAISVLANPKEAAKKGQESTARRLSNWRKKKRLDKRICWQICSCLSEFKPS